MVSERDFQLVDDYLANRMPAGDRASFEKQLQVDMELTSELNLQKSLVEGLQRARVVELKNMLSKIPVSTIATTSSTVVTKAALWIGVSALVGTGLYYLFSEKDTPEVATPLEIVTNNKSEVPVEPVTPVEKPVAIAEEKKEKKTHLAEPKKVIRAPKKEATVEPKIEVFDPSAELQENSSEPNEEILIDNEVTPVSTSTIAVEIDSNNRKFNFHYKLEGDKLILYGEFEKNLYEILEFIGEEKRTAFLYYKQNYYTLKQINKATNLVPVKDPVLLKKLREYSEGK
jgi:hypothetical protein